ncbi:MAG: hypothetical protein OEX12_12585 [Gammaproteobacteria bacterium]|nr:hypothetical protein [Gammaproteobacteria bacterium]
MSRNQDGIFSPATKLLQRMPIARKFSLILLIFILPLSYLSWGSITAQSQQIRFYQQQQEGIEQFRHSQLALQQIMWLRDISYAGANGLPIEQGRIKPAIDQIESAFKQLQGLGSESSQAQLAAVIAQWQALQNQQLEPLPMHGRYSELSLALQQYQLRFAEDYDILLGKDLHAYQLSQLVVSSLMHSTDLVSAMRGLGGGIIARGNFTPDSYIKLSYYAGELERPLLPCTTPFRPVKTAR